MIFHGTALRAEGATDAEIAAARALTPSASGLPRAEQALFAWVLQVAEDPHSVTAAQVDALRAVGFGDAALVEALEVLNLGNSLNTFCDALDIGPDDFLTYGREASEL